MNFLIRKAGEYTSPHSEGSLEIIPNSMEEAFELGLLFKGFQQNNSEITRGSRDMIRILIPLTKKTSFLGNKIDKTLE